MEDEDVRVSTDLNPSEDFCKKNLKAVHVLHSRPGIPTSTVGQEGA